MTIIYGVDITQSFTNLDVRDAIIRCFVQAHQEVLEKDLADFSDVMSKQDFENLQKMNIHQLVTNLFKNTKGNFNNPSKKELVQVCDKLAEFSKQFRSPEIINRHYSEIMQLVGKL